MFNLERFSYLSSLHMLEGFEENKTSKDLHMVTLDLPNIYENPSAHLVHHMEFIKSEYFKMFGNVGIGRVFEYLFLDSLLNFLHDKKKIKTIYMNKSANVLFPDIKKYVSDIDILFNEEIAFFLKTSLRERWKQWDRDGLVIESCSTIKKSFIFFRENDVDSPQKTIERAKSLSPQFMAQGSILTIYDENGMYNLFNSLTEEKTYGHIHPGGGQQLEFNKSC